MKATNGVSAEKIEEILAFFNRGDGKVFSDIGDEGVLVTDAKAFNKLSCDEQGIKVNDNDEYKYKIYKVFDGITFYMMSDTKEIVEE